LQLLLATGLVFDLLIVCALVIAFIAITTTRLLSF